MIINLKHSAILKIFIYVWVILFVGFSYFQYSNIHTHKFNGRTITHSHISNNVNESTPIENNSNSHKHTSDEFFYYSIIGSLLTSIVLMVAFLILFGRNTNSFRKSEEFFFNDFIYSYNSLRAPPVL